MPGSIGSDRFVESGVNSAGDRMFSRNRSAGVAAEVAESYSDMTKDDLSAELERRGLPKSGNKDELIARLEESDS